MHPLKLYLQDIDETIQDFSLRVGVSRQSLYRIIGGRQTPRPALARRIVEATGGSIAFEALYHKTSEVKTDVGGRSPEDSVSLEQERIRVALAIVINHLAPQTEHNLPDDVVNIAAEAVVNTYAALSRLTSRRGPARLRQALRPVLEEILRELSDASLPADVLDRGAVLAAQLYLQPHLRSE